MNQSSYMIQGPIFFFLFGLEFLFRLFLCFFALALFILICIIILIWINHVCNGSLQPSCSTKVQFSGSFCFFSMYTVKSQQGHKNDVNDMLQEQCYRHTSKPEPTNICAYFCLSRWQFFTDNKITLHLNIFCIIY